MPPIPTTKPNLLSRFTLLGGPDHGGSAVDSHQDSAGTANTGAGPSWSGHALMHTVPKLHPVGSSTHQCHEFRPAIRPSRSGNSIVATSQYSALSTPSNRYLLRHPTHLPTPVQRFYEPTSGTHGWTTSFFPGSSSQSGPSWSIQSAASTIPDPLLPVPVGGSTFQYQKSWPPVHASGSENNIGDSSQAAALFESTLSDQGTYQPPPHLPLPAPQSYYNTPECASAHGGTTSFFPDATSQFFAHSAARTVPNLLPPSYGSTSQFHGSWPPIRPTWSENNIESSQFTANALSMPSDEHLRPPPFPAPHWSYDSLTVPRAHEATMSFLSGASKFQMHDINYYKASHITVNRGDSVSDSPIDGWSLLMEKVARNALHNSCARFDAPKCDEDTRVEVTNELMEWIEDRNAPQRLLCMTGAAGSGKSCLQQTAAEKCGKSNILAASFFLLATDPTRNTVDPIIPTIAYQLGRGNPTLKWSIKTAIERDPLIFDQSLEAQTTALIVRPVEDLRDMGTDLRSLPYVILIDGLNECKSRDPECKAEDQQAELLTAIRQCLLVGNLPFRIFIASRPELAIHSSLQPGGHLHNMAYHIQLSDKYDATADMCRYLRRRFEDIGLCINDPKWFSGNDIETLVQAGSGQFIYVATVYKYISTPRASPAARLKIVLTWTPREGQATRPFEVLDKLYTNILLDAKNAYEAVDSHHGCDFLLLFRTHHVEITGFMLSANATFWAKFAADLLSVLLSLEPQGRETLISDLRCLVAFKPGSPPDQLHLYLYHKSFSDFLEEPSHAKDLFVPQSRVYTHLAKCLMQHIIKCPLDFDSLPAKWEELPLSRLHRESLGQAVGLLPFSLRSPRNALDDDEVVGFTQNGGWQKVNNLVPLLDRVGHWFRYRGEKWISAVCEISDHLKDRKPETAAVISAFAKKWRDDRKRWEKEYPEGPRFW